MRFEIVVLLITAFIIGNIYTDGKYLKIALSWKKYYQMISIGFVGLSAYLFIRKYPGHSRSLFTHANGLVKYLPIDKDATNLLFDLTSGGGSMFSQPQQQQQQQQENRIMNSGRVDNNNKAAGATKRSVSETKKKYVASSQDWKCGQCKQQLDHTFEIDHKMRLEYGGGNDVQNLIALCRNCHGKKTASENM